MPSKGGIGLRTTRLNDGSHRVIGLALGSSAASDGDLMIGEEVTHIDDVGVTNLPSEVVGILLAGMPDSEVRLGITSLGGADRTVSVVRIASDKPLISWSKAVLPLRLRRQELEKTRPSSDGPGIEAEQEALELAQLIQGEATFLKVRGILIN